MRDQMPFCYRLMQGYDVLSQIFDFQCDSDTQRIMQFFGMRE